MQERLVCLDAFRNYFGVMCRTCACDSTPQIANQGQYQRKTISQICHGITELERKCASCNEIFEH